MSSRSFATMQSDFNTIAKALMHFCATASKKLREQNSVAGRVSVFIRTNSFRRDLKQYSAVTDIILMFPTNDVRAISHWARKCLEKIFREGYFYKKVGVYLDDIGSANTVQLDLFGRQTDDDRAQSSNLMEVLDKVNNRYGNGALKLAAEGFDRNRRIKQQGLRSPNYTTSWEELPVVILK